MPDQTRPILPLVDLDHRLMIFWTPRCGSTASIVWFFHAIGYGDRVSGASPHAIRWAWIDEHPEIYRNLDEIYAREDLTTSVVARNPFDRAVSSYFLAITSDRTSRWGDVVEHWPHLDDDRRISFRQWVDYLHEIDLDRCNFHWRRQTAQAWFERDLRIDTFVRVESLSHDLARLGARVGLDAPLRHASVTPRTHEHPPDRLVDLDRVELAAALGTDRRGRPRFPASTAFYADDELRDRVMRLYARDFDALQYDTTSPSSDPAAVITRDGAMRSGERAVPVYLGRRLTNPRTLTLTLSTPRWPSPGEEGLLHAADARGLFELIAVDPTVALFHGPWSAALLAHLCRMLAPGGELVLPVASTTSPLVSVDQLTALLGSEPLQCDGTLARFAPKVAPPEPPSLLSWALRDFAAVVHSFLLARTLRRATDVLMLDDLILELLVDGVDRAASARTQLATAGFSGGDAWFERPEERATVVYGAEYERVARIVAWHLLAAGRRAALVRWLMEVHELGACGRIVDLGGRYGMLGAELALHPGVAAAEVVVSEFGTAYLAAAVQLYRAHRNALEGRYRFKLSEPDTTELSGEHRLIGMFGSLLGLSRDVRGPVLERCREALEPGGLLVVEQPLGASSDLTEDDLDDLLRPLGRLRHFAAHNFREIGENQNVRGSVRVVCAR